MTSRPITCPTLTYYMPYAHLLHASCLPITCPTLTYYMPRAYLLHAPRLPIACLMLLQIEALYPPASTN